MLRRALWVCLPVLALLCAGVAWLALTSSGARTLLDVAARFAAAEIRYDSLDGTLARGLDVGGLHVRAAGAVLELERMTVRWRPWALRRGRLLLERLELTRGEFRATTRETSTRVSLPTAPLPIDVETIELSDVTIVINDDAQRIDRLTGRVHADTGGVEIPAFTLQMAGQRLAGRATLNARGETVELDVDYAGATNDTPLAAHLSATGQLNALRVEVRASAPLAAQLSGAVDVAADAPTVQLTGSASPNDFLAARGGGLALDDLHFTLTGAAQTLRLHAAATLRPPAGPDLAVTVDVTRLPEAVAGGLRANLQWRLRPSTPMFGVAQFAGGGEVAWADEQLHLSQQLTAPAPITIEGLFDGGDGGRIDLTGRWQTLALALGDTTLRSAQGHVEINGRYPDLAIAIEGDFHETRVGDFAARLRAQLGDDRLALTGLTATLLDGHLAASGELATLQPPRGRFDVKAQALNLANVRAGLDTRLDIDTAVDVDGTRAHLDVHGATGRWRGQKFDARGKLDVEAGRLALTGMQIGIGRNRLELNGSYGPVLDLVAKLQAPALAELDASLAGALQASATLRGTPAAPVLEVDATATSLRVGDLGIGEARASGAIVPAASSRVQLDASKVRVGTAQWGTVTLDAHGSLAAHTLELRAGSGARRVQLAARGRWQDQRADGTLTALALALPELGVWQLRDAAHYRYDGGALTLSPLCLAQGTASACIEASELAREAGSLQAHLQHLPTTLVTPWLPPHLAIEGEINGELAATHGAGGWQPRGTLSGEGVTLIAQSTDGSATRVPVTPLRLDLRVAEDGAQAFELRAASPALGRLQASGRLRGVPAAPVIDVQLQATSADLSALGELVPALDGSAGGFELTASVAGPFAQPTIDAQGRLVDGRLVVERAGVTIDSLRLQATMRTPDHVEIDLMLGQGDQQLSLVGGFAQTPGWPFSAHVASKRFTIMRRADLDADIAPELDIDGSLDALRLRGTLGIPLLNLRLQKLPPDAVAVSADEVVIDAQGAVVIAEDTESSARRYYRDHLTGELDITLGDDAHVKGLGLSARLAGGLRFTKETGSPGFADGRITLKDGEYAAYRQTLTIDKGELLFAGPIDNPSLNVLALRPELDLKAGVAITGTVQTPIVRLYSVPTMADVDTLSYVITGRPLSGTSSASAGLLAKAALGLGLDQAAGLTDQIRQWFGLDELGINGGESVQDTSFVAGKQLSPRLNARSEFNPFDQLWSVFLRYKLTEHWSVEGESGARQGADILYSIEREKLF